MTRKKTATKKGNAIPKGFTAITNQAKTWPSEETQEGDSITGVVVDYKTVKVKRGKKVEDAQIICIETDDGVREVWESAVLQPLFEEDFTEYRVFIQYDGLGKKKSGQNAPKLFTIAYEGDD